jgi:hypothetical protein
VSGAECHAESRVPAPITASLLSVCARDVSDLRVRCAREEHDDDWHNGPVGDFGWMHWQGR